MVDLRIPPPCLLALSGKISPCLLNGKQMSFRRITIGGSSATANLIPFRAWGETANKMKHQTVFQIAV